MQITRNHPSDFRAACDIAGLDPDRTISLELNFGWTGEADMVSVTAEVALSATQVRQLAELTTEIEG